MGIFYSTSESKDKNIEPHQTQKKHGPLSLDCHVHTGRKSKKQKLAVGQGKFELTMSSFLVGMEQHHIWVREPHYKLPTYKTEVVSSTPGPTWILGGVEKEAVIIWVSKGDQFTGIFNFWLCNATSQNMQRVVMHTCTIQNISIIILTLFDVSIRVSVQRSGNLMRFKCSATHWCLFCFQ